MKYINLAPDYGLYIITAAVPRLKRTHEDVAAAAIAGGATAIQFREKQMADDEFASTASRLSGLAEDAGVLFIINDRAGLVSTCAAAGVHIGQEDMNLRQARSILGLDPIIGVSVSNRTEALAAEAEGADYLGVGPLFMTSSKHDAGPPIGMDELTVICRSVIIPVIAIGGINIENAAKVIDAGAAGIAVIAAVAEAPDMVEAVEELKGCVKQDVAT